MTGLRRLALLLTAIGFVAACSSNEAPVAKPHQAPPTPLPRPYEWGEEAERWTIAMFPALREQGGAAWVWFWDPDVEFDYRSMAPLSEPLRGSDAFDVMQRIVPPNADAVLGLGPAYLSTTGVVTVNWLDWGPSGMDVFPFTREPAVLANVLSPIGPEGAERMDSMFSADSWPDRRADHETLGQAEHLVQQWIDAWSIDSATARDLYADDAVLTDSIPAIQLQGAEVIGAHAEIGDREWRTTTVGAGHEAIFPISTRPGVLEGVVFIADGFDTDYCPGRQAIVLRTEAGTVVQEDRYWDIEAARRCLPREGRSDGWWVGQNLDFEPRPTEDLTTRTGLVTVDGQQIDVYNGTPALDAFLAWGIGRFAAADLDAPRISSVTFTSYLDLCTDAAGRLVWRELTVDVYLCVQEATICPVDGCETYAVRPVRTLLHELSHAWLRENLDEEDREDFTELIGLDVWASIEIGWTSQAREHAADTIAWGLADRPLPNILGFTDIGTFTDRFEWLTGEDPLTPRAN